MKQFSIIVSICLIVLFCSGDEKAYESVVETIDGIEYIHNPGVPIHPNKKVIFEEELSLTGENEETGEVYVYHFYDLYIDDNGNIFIPDIEEHNIKVFDKNGKYIKTMGRKGQGPGEFQYISHIDFLSNGNMIVVDSDGRRSSAGYSKTFCDKHKPNVRLKPDDRWKITDATKA